jgi:hypothetical protein
MAWKHFVSSYNVCKTRCSSCIYRMFPQSMLPLALKSVFSLNLNPIRIGPPFLLLLVLVNLGWPCFDLNLFPCIHDSTVFHLFFLM